MASPDGMITEIKELNKFLRERRLAGGTSTERRLQAGREGSFFRLRRLTGEEIRSFFQGHPLVGVDGSFNNYGASFPYVVTFFRALARSSRPDPQTGERIWAHRIFSPLLPRYREQVREKLELGLEPEDALARLRWEILATLEAEVGKQALIMKKPRLLLWDGGFARLEAHAAATWQQIRDEALQQGTIMLGVTEEIATASLVQALSPDAGDIWGDREVLYGLLKPGEVFCRQERGGSKRKRVYVRFASHPQVVAVDYLPEQEQELAAALNFLYTITPSHGRGFPLWLDVVDAEVRITREEMEALLATYLDPVLTEVYLRPLRSRREL
ncbi:MAG TPA: DNA double-strand break repair nuclease NurA [Syntrophomonadaceae bacterium]|nr:DNA double-strand break repair nuclease NurA [Syntrophomonadaceae bacterium]